MLRELITSSALIVLCALTARAGAEETLNLKLQRSLISTKPASDEAPLACRKPTGSAATLTARRKPKAM